MVSSPRTNPRSLCRSSVNLAHSEEMTYVLQGYCATTSVSADQLDTCFQFSRVQQRPGVSADCLLPCEYRREGQVLSLRTSDTGIQPTFNQGMWASNQCFPLVVKQKNSLFSFIIFSDSASEDIQPLNWSTCGRHHPMLHLLYERGYYAEKY